MLHPTVNLQYLQKQHKLIVSHPLVVLLQHRISYLITVPLFNFILVQFAETLSITSVITTCSALWKCSKISEVFLSAKFIRKLLLSYGIAVIEPIVKQQQQIIIHQSSKSLAADHTYKFVKKLTVGKFSNKVC